MMKLELSATIVAPDGIQIPIEIMDRAAKEFLNQLEKFLTTEMAKDGSYKRFCAAGQKTQTTLLDACRPLGFAEETIPLSGNKGKGGGSEPPLAQTQQ